MKELLGNAAVIGLIGVVIGSILSLLGVMYSEYIKLKTIKLQQKQISKDNLQKTFSDFLHLINSYQNFYMSKFINFENFMEEKEVIALIKNAETVLAELDLKASEKLSVECHNLFNKTFTSIINQQDFNMQYRTVIDLMKKELKIDN